MCGVSVLINLKKLKEYEKDLISYEGYLPFFIRSILPKGYFINLSDKPCYNQVVKEIEKSREYSKKEYIKELKEWCEKNPEYKDLLN